MKEQTVVKIILIAGVLLVGFLGSRLIGNLYYNKLIKLDKTIEQNNQNYKNQINQITDPTKAVRFGFIFFKNNQPEIAQIAFLKATELDPKWRDAWLFRGVAELKTANLNTALDCLKKAEGLDPLYPLTYRYLAVAYAAIGDDESAKFAADKMAYLEKTFPKKSD